MGGLVSYSSGDTPADPRGTVVSPIEVERRGPTFTDVPLPPPTPAPAAKKEPAPLNYGSHADIAQRRELARKIGKAVHLALFGVNGKPSNLNPAGPMTEFDFSVFRGETQGSTLRKEFLSMLMNETNKPEMRYETSPAMAIGDEHNLSEATAAELATKYTQAELPKTQSAYLKYRWRKDWAIKEFYLVLTLDKERPVRIAEASQK